MWPIVPISVELANSSLNRKDYCWSIPSVIPGTWQTLNKCKLNWFENWENRCLYKELCEQQKQELTSLDPLLSLLLPTEFFFLRNYKIACLPFLIALYVLITIYGSVILKIIFIIFLRNCLLWLVELIFALCKSTVLFFWFCFNPCLTPQR